MRTLSFGLVDNRAVFMDERTDSYFTLDAADQEHLHRLLKRAEPLACDVALLNLLGVADDVADVVQAHYPAPLESLLEQDGFGRASLSEVIRVASLVRSTRSQLRSQPIEIVFRNLAAAAGNRLKSELHREDLLPDVGRFLKARKLVPARPNCLLDSLSLLRWLGPHRRSLALLFGVKLDPFAAHCWVQSDDLLLNDRVETVAAFTPVRVIECSQVTQ